VANILIIFIAFAAIGDWYMLLVFFKI
jgi:hypothetical protein